MIGTERPPAEVHADESRNCGPDDTALVAAVAQGTSDQNQLYVRYRRPLLQILLHRRVPRDAAEDILQQVLMRAVRKIRGEGLEDPGNLRGFLCKTAWYMAIEYWREQSQREYDSDAESLCNIKDETTLSLEERVDHERLAQSVRNLLDHLPVERDRKVLERFYLREESRVTIRESLRLTDMQFNQVLWRARQRFGEILRQHGLGGNS